MQTLARLYNLPKPYWKTLLISGFLLLFRTGLKLAPPVFQRQIVDTIIATRDLSRQDIWVGALVDVVVLQQLNNRIDVYIRHAPGQRIILDLRVKIHDYLQRPSRSFFERTSTGELMSLV